MDTETEDYKTQALDKLHTPKFPIYDTSDMANLPRPSWLFRNLLFQREVSLLHGPSGSFKSFVALDLAMRLRHGLNWHDRPLKPTRIVYVAGEGFEMFLPRKLAWFARNGIKPCDDGVGTVPFAVALTDPEDVKRFIEDVQHKITDPIGLVIFDTLSTCTAGQNENDVATMTSAIENAKKIGRALGCHVMMIHHPGKDLTRGARGSSSLKANVDTEITCERPEEGNECMLHVAKQKNGKDGQRYQFIATAHNVGLTDDDGYEIDSLCLSPVDVSKTIATRQEADRRMIASVMSDGDEISLTKLALRTEVHLGKKNTAITRIKKALPINEPQTVIIDDTQYVLNRIENKNGLSHVVTMGIDDRNTGEMTPSNSLFAAINGSM